MEVQCDVDINNAKIQPAQIHFHPDIVLLCIKLLATGLWFSPVSSTNKTEHNDTTEILLKVALSTIYQPTHSLG
jgi:hypothetical protein